MKVLGWWCEEIQSFKNSYEVRPDEFKRRLCRTCRNNGTGDQVERGCIFAYFGSAEIREIRASRRQGICANLVQKGKGYVRNRIFGGCKWLTCDSGVVRCVRRSLSCAYLHRTTDCYERVSVRGKVLTRRGEGGCSLCDLSCCVGSKTRKNRRPAHSFLTLRSPSGRLHIQLRRQRRHTTQPR